MIRLQYFGGQSVEYDGVNKKCHSLKTKFRQIEFLVIRDWRYLKRVGVVALLKKGMILVVGF